MGAQNVIQVIIAAVMLVNIVAWWRVAQQHEGLLRVIAWPPLTWCLHALLRYAVLFAVYLTSGQVLSPEQARFFSWWTTAINLHGGLSCLTLLYFVRDWGRLDGRG